MRAVTLGQTAFPADALWRWCTVSKAWHIPSRDFDLLVSRDGVRRCGVASERSRSSWVPAAAPSLRIPGPTHSVEANNERPFSPPLCGNDFLGHGNRNLCHIADVDLGGGHFARNRRGHA